MAEKPNPKETATIEELITTIVYTQDALVRVLARKGIVTEREVLDEIKTVRAEHDKGHIVTH